jgi:uncharacterized repeat protein (TIGR01451 family)
VQVTLRAQQPGTIRNRATATAGNLKQEAEAVTEFFGASALLLEVVDTNDPVEVGGETSYVILLRNQGSAPITEIRLTAQIPAELEVGRVTGPANHRIEGPTLGFEPMTLQPNGEARFVVHARAKAPGDVRFKVEVSAKELSAGTIQEEESTTSFTDIRSLKEKEPPGRPTSRSP